MKKRSLAMLCAVVMLITVMLPLAALANMQYRYVYTSNGKSLNLRSAPVTHANNRVTHIPYGAKVAVDSYVNNSTWAYVKYNGMWGYVMTRYLVKNPPAPKPVFNNTTGTNTGAAEFNGFVATSYKAAVRPSTPGGFVNLRWAPSKSEGIQARLTDGQILEVISENKTWAQVRVADTGAVGFIMRAFISTVVDNGSDS